MKIHWGIFGLGFIVIGIIMVMVARDAHCKESDKSAPTVVIEEDQITITRVLTEGVPEVILGRIWVKKAAFMSFESAPTATKPTTKKVAVIKSGQIKGVKLFCCADDGEWCDVGCCPEGKQYGSEGGLCYPTMSACTASGTGLCHTCNSRQWCGS